MLLMIRTNHGHAHPAVSADAAFRHFNSAPLPSVIPFRSVPTSLRLLIRENLASNRFTAIRSKFLLLAAAILHSAGVPVEAAGESPPAEVLHPATSPGWKNHWFSVDVDLGASRLVVGSEQGSYAYSGTVHVYLREGGVWKLEEIVAHKEMFSNPSFGSDVALSDDERTLFVGAPSDVATTHGAVHVFRRDETISTHTGSEQTLSLPSYRSHGSQQFFRLSYQLP